MYLIQSMKTVWTVSLLYSTLSIQNVSVSAAQNKVFLYLYIQSMKNAYISNIENEECPLRSADKCLAVSCAGLPNKWTQPLLGEKIPQIF
jgi:hypothetical protein